MPEPAAEPRQRWRLVVARTADAPQTTQRDVVDAWLAALDAADLPLARPEGSSTKPRVAFGAPLPVGLAAEGELIDLVLTERWPAWRVREALAGHLPPGWRLVDVYDVWLQGPPLAGRVAAADYRVTIGSAVDAASLERAAAGLLAADRLPRERAKGGGTVAYDLRPLLIDIRVEPGPPTIIRARTRFHAELGTGRPQEVVAALAERLGSSLEVTEIVRERLITSDDSAFD
jgi:radical SAM-linked protein